MNIQNTIINTIHQQLYLNNYLVIPNFGGFVLQTSAAHLNYNGSVIFPPSKTLTFNSQLKQNDGILVLSLQNKLNCSSAEALNYLNDFAIYCTSILKTSKRITFENIGFFYLNFENTICFEPQTHTNFLTNSFGLTQLTIKKIELNINPTHIKKETVFVDRIIEKANHPTNKTVKKQNYKKIIVPSLVILLVLSVLSLIVSNSKITGKLKASLFGVATKPIYTPLLYSNLSLQSSLTQNATYVADANGIASLNLETDKTLCVNINANTIAVATKNTTPNTKLNAATNVALSTNNQNYKIVLGCFTIIQNAERFANSLQKNNILASINTKNNKGLYVVSSGNFASKEEAVLQLTQLKNNYPSAWVKNPD